MKNKLIENYESIAWGENKNVYQVPISGWNIENPKDLIKELMEEYFDYKIKDMKILKTNEMAYGCSRFDCGVDANDDGFSHYVQYRKEWKRGLGKCTIFDVDFAFAVTDEQEKSE